MQLPPVDSRRRRLRILAIATAVFLVLVAIGRYATLSAAPTAATLPSASISADVARASASAPIDGGASPAGVDTSPSSDAATSDAYAVESLSDGAVVVDLNRASEDELRRLPGIGPVRARAILALRTRMGRFKSVEDLARIKGVGRALLRRLRPWTRAS